MISFLLKKEKSFKCLFWGTCKDTLWNIFHVYSVRVFCKQANHVKRIDIHPNKPLSALGEIELERINTPYLSPVFRHESNEIEDKRGKCAPKNGSRYSMQTNHVGWRPCWRFNLDGSRHFRYVMFISFRKLRSLYPYPKSEVHSFYVLVFAVCSVFSWIVHIYLSIYINHIFVYQICLK